MSTSPSRTGPSGPRAGVDVPRGGREGPRAAGGVPRTAKSPEVEPVSTGAAEDGEGRCGDVEMGAGAAAMASGGCSERGGAPRPTMRWPGVVWRRDDAWRPALTPELCRALSRVVTWFDRLPWPSATLLTVSASFARSSAAWRRASRSRTCERSSRSRPCKLST